jgi:hypothetical protein
VVGGVARDAAASRVCSAFVKVAMLRKVIMSQQMSDISLGVNNRYR